MTTCIVIPHYDHLAQFRRILLPLVEQDVPLIVVDDASPADVADKLAELLRELAPGATLVRHCRNLGKGGAVMTGLRSAQIAGYTHALQIDADGQHDIRNIGSFISLSAAHPGSLICGRPTFGDDISMLRYYARYITLCLSWLETLSGDIKDALCGFRLYPLAPIVEILDRSKPGERMAFDPEILVRAVWAGIPLYFAPVRVLYPTDGKSHFNYVGDNVEIGWMHARLIAGMIVRMPRLIRDKLRRSRRNAVV